VPISYVKTYFPENEFYLDVDSMEKAINRHHQFNPVDTINLNSYPISSKGQEYSVSKVSEMSFS